MNTTAETFVRTLKPHVHLHRDLENGIAWIEDGTSGVGHSCHPNIAESGHPDIVYGSLARVVLSHGFWYNTDDLWANDDYAQLAAKECRCEACIERRSIGDEQTPPFTHEGRRIIRAPKPTKGKPVEIKILGQKDPRGPDNSVFVWIDDTGRLHITTYKANRCYQFEKIVETPGYVDVVAK